MRTSSRKRPSEKRRQSFLERMGQAVLGLGIHPHDSKLPGELELNLLRRGRRRAELDEDRVVRLTLTEANGVLRWEGGSDLARPVQRRRAARAAAEEPGEVVAQYKFERLAGSDVGRLLEKIDGELTPGPRGLGELMAGQLRFPPKGVRPPLDGKALLFVHGTFSNSRNLLGELQSTGHGREFLNWAAKRYQRILAFDHPTVSVSPVLNALDLARLFQGSKARVDVVCHSRGGLVTRWWREVVRQGFLGDGRTVFVGGTLAGTSLAAPPRLRAALTFLTNVSRALDLAAETAAMALPFFKVAAGLMSLLTSAGSALARSPVIDAAVGMVPGLVGMSRIGNNPELLRLREGSFDSEDYYAVKCDFEPKGEGWAFWRYFVGLKRRAADVGADLVFESPNDLVVDTSSMTDLADSTVVPKGRVWDFGTSDRVHHTNYFRQRETLEFIAKVLGAR